MRIRTYLKRGCAVLLVLLLTAGILSAGVTAKAASANETDVYNYLKKEMGLNTAAACGVLANISIESDFDPHCWSDNGTSYGICKWHAERFTRLKDFCSKNGLDYTTLRAQLLYLDYELRNFYPYVYDKLHTVDNTGDGAYEAAYTWCYYYEVPSGYNRGVSDQRGSLAQNTYWPVYGAQEHTGTVEIPNFTGITATTQAFARFFRILYYIIGVLQNML